MSVADKLNKLTTDITSAYDAVSTKAGTVPANKNTENLADAILSISAEQPNHWGKLVYHPIEWDAVVSNTQYCDVEIVDITKFKDVFGPQYGSKTFTFTTSPGSSIYWDINYNNTNYDESDLLNVLGIRVTNVTNRDEASFQLLTSSTDLGSEAIYLTQEQWENNIMSGFTVDLPGRSLPMNMIVEFYYGDSITSIPSGTLQQAVNLEFLSQIPPSVTTIGSSYYLRVNNLPTVFPAGSQVNNVYIFASYIHPVVFPDGIETLNMSMNANVSFALPSSLKTFKLTTQGNQTFNQLIVLPVGLTRFEWQDGGSGVHTQPIVLPNTVTDLLLHSAWAVEHTPVPSSVRNLRLDFYGNSYSDLSVPYIMGDSVTHLTLDMLNCKQIPDKIILSSSLEELNASRCYYAERNFTLDVGSLSPDVVVGIDAEKFLSTRKTKGITIAISGANRQAWLDAFPNSTGSLYRKLVDGGE